MRNQQFLQYKISISTQRFEKHINIEIYQIATTYYWPSSLLIWRAKSFLSRQEQKLIFLLYKETARHTSYPRFYIVMLHNQIRLSPLSKNAVIFHHHNILKVICFLLSDIINPINNGEVEISQSLIAIFIYEYISIFCVCSNESWCLINVNTAKKLNVYKQREGHFQGYCCSLLTNNVLLRFKANKYKNDNQMYHITYFDMDEIPREKHRYKTNVVKIITSIVKSPVITCVEFFSCTIACCIFSSNSIVSESILRYPELSSFSPFFPLLIVSSLSN